MSARSLFALPLLLLIATVARADFVDGQLECSDGTPLANCLVTVVRTDTMAPPVSMNGITDASGVFRVRLPCTDADPALFIISSPCCSHDWSRTTTSCGADLGTLECTDCVSAPPHGCVDELSAGLDFSLAIDSLGQGWSWGKNDDGQLGIGIPGSFLTIPAPVSDAAGTGQLSDLVAISAGGTENASHALALDSSGHVWAWGHGAHGQLGDGTATASNLPVQVLTSSGAPLADIVAISAGGYHSLALDSSSQVWAWGRDVEGQLGQGTAGTIVDRAVQVNGPGGLPVLTDISAIAAGGRHSLALRTDGTVLAWGFNSSGQLGDCSVTQRELPTKVRDSGCGGSFVGNIAIAAGDEHSLVLDADLDAWSFGRNIVGQLGDGSGVAFSTAPVQVVDTALGDVHAISAGGRHSMALDSALEAWSWGSNASGVLGAGSGVASSNVPVPVVSGSLSPVALVDGGGFHSLALRSDDTAWGFGANGSGQLGDGSTTAASVPVAVLFPLGADPSDCGDCDDDFTPPEIDCPDVLTVNADAACNGTPPVLPVTDNCDPNPVLTFDPPVLSGAGPHVVTYTATDSNGNTSSCVVTIVVQDLKGPSLTCQVALGECPIIGGGGSTLTVGCGETVCFRARALDNCGGLELTNDLDPAGNATTPGILLTSDFSHVFATAGTHAVTWTATDTAGQSTSCTVYVTVTDEPPVMECGVATNIISTVGDDDDFANVDPGDAPTSGPGFVPCTGSNPTNGGVAPMDSLVQDSCRHWVHEYVLPSEEHCVAEARLTLDWRLLSTHPATCLPCPGAGNRPTETLRFYSAAGSLAFNRCFDPFAGALYGSCPPVTSGVTTLDLMDFPDVIDLLDGSPLTISITDDTAIDVATLELSFVATGSPIVVPVDDTACCATVTLGQCAVEDDCSDELTITNDYDPAQGGEVTDCFELGLHEVTFTATDSAGNNTSCTVELEVVDVTPPELVCPHPAEISVGADCTAFPPWPTAEDNCDPFPVITASPSILVGAGTHVVTYTATDDSGNSTSCTVTFEVLDSKAPSLTCGVKTGACDGTGPFSPTLTAECGEELCFSARAQDLCGPITLVNDLDAASGVSTPGTMIGSEFTHVFDSPGTYSVVWTATDGAGNSTICTTFVTVVDTTGPVLDCGVVDTIVSAVGDDDDFANVGPDDSSTSGPGYPGCSASLGHAPLDSLANNRCRTWVHEYTLPADACMTGARLTLDWRLTEDLCGGCMGGFDRPTEWLQFSTASGNLLFDRCFEPFSGALYGDCPTPNTSGITTLDLEDFPGVMDLLDGTPLTISIGDDTAIDIATLEIDVLTGSTPGVTVVEADPDRCCATVTLAACGSDDCSELIAIVNDHQPDDQDVVTDCFPLGFHEVTFTAVDGLENVSTCTVSFEVVDGTPPEITCPDPATFFADGDCQVTPPAATVFDNCDADPVVTVSPPVLEGSGFHTVTYTATDASGNTSSCTTVIEVRDVTPPALNCGVRLGACPGSGPVQSSVTVDCGQELCFTARASDACGPISLVDDLTGAGSISTPGTLVGSSLTHVFTTPGTHVVTWTATDGAGNTSTCSTVVRVLGSAAPDLECSPVSTLRNLVGDDDDFGSEDPGDAPMTGPGFPGCLGANPTELGMDSTDPNACRVWVHDYALPPDACVVDARLILDWEIRSRACGPCPAGNLRPTEHIQLASAAGAISFGRCFDPFAAVMYGDCPNPTSSGVTTLELSLFPGALDLLDGSPLTVAIGDDTLIDRAILEIDSVLAGSNTITVVTPPGGPCCATATVGSCATAGCEEIVSVTNDHDPSQGELVTDCFPLGITPVTFTVTDAGGGSSDCTVYVEVRNGGCSPPDGQATDPSGPVSSRTGRELQP